MLHRNPTGCLRGHETRADDASKRQPPNRAQALPGVELVPRHSDDTEQHRRRAKEEIPKRFVQLSRYQRYTPRLRDLPSQEVRPGCY